MRTVTTKIIFPVILEVHQFETQVVKLGGVFPEIEIERVNSTPGLHYFKIAKSLPHSGPDMIASAVAESELQIDLFWNILSYVRDMTLRSTGEVLYEVDGGALQEFNPPVKPTMFSVAISVSANWFNATTSLFNKQYDLDLLKRFNFSRAIQEPIGKFISLYSLLSSFCEEDKQIEIDMLIKTVEPNVAMSPSPKNKKNRKLSLPDYVMNLPIIAKVALLLKRTRTSTFIFLDSNGSSKSLSRVKFMPAPSCFF